MKELFIVYLRKAKRVLCYLNTCFRGRRVSETGIINYCRSRSHRASQARQREIPPTAPITTVHLQLSEVLLAASDRSSLPGPRGQCAVQVSGGAHRTLPMALSLFRPEYLDNKRCQNDSCFELWCFLSFLRSVSHCSVFLIIGTLKTWQPALL